MTRVRKAESNDGMTPEDVIEALRKNIEKARGLAYVEKPLSWALYRTWRAVDGVERGKDECSARAERGLSAQHTGCAGAKPPTERSERGRAK